MHTVVLRNAEFHGLQAHGKRSMLVGGGRILWVGEEPANLPAPLDAISQVVDLENRGVIPGLIDCHVHVTGGGGEAGFKTRVPPVPLSQFTRNGITTVVGLLGTDDVARGTPELLACLHSLREEGLNVYGFTGGYHVPPTTLTGSVRGDLVFSDLLIGLGEVAISDHRSSQPTLDELLRLASEAHVAGLMTGKAGIVHLHLGDGPRGLSLVREALEKSELPARVFHPTHVNRRRALFDEAVALAKVGCTVDITAFPVADGEDAWSAADAYIRYLESGAPLERVTISSDAGGCLPCFDLDGRVSHMEVGSAGALMATLRELLARGLTLEEALPPFTSNPARLLRLKGKGEIAVGASADLVALDEAGQVSEVIIGGEIHVLDGKPVKRGTFEA